LSKLNASTKWIVLVAHTAAVWARRDFTAPFIVVGSIWAVALAEILKKKINQARPAGAAPLDPGMPSSHALVTCFSATAWSLHFISGDTSALAGGGSAGHALSHASCVAVSSLLLAVAGCVSALRVACGFHSVAQVTVGAGVGVFAAFGWHALGAAFLRAVDLKSATAVAWAGYLVFSAVFIRERILRKWVGGRDAHCA
jgi:membrane-associated phospholipid phosphatase